MSKLIQRSMMFLIIIGGLIWFWNSFRSSTFEVAVVQNISETEINVINLGGRERTISVPLNLMGLVEINKQYTVFYDKRIFDKHRLRKISVSRE